MIRQAEHEQPDRLNVETLDWVFIVRAKEGRRRSLFEAQALTNLLKIGSNAQGHPHLLHRRARWPVAAGVEVSRPPALAPSPVATPST